jgi:hypothetical protein
MHGQKSVKTMHLILCNPAVHCRIHMHLPSVPIMQQINPFQAIASHILKISLILYSHLRLDVPNGLSLSAYPTKTFYAPLLSSIRATCLSHLILFALMARMLFGVEYR